MDSRTSLTKKEILELDVRKFYSMLTQKEYEEIYNLMSENFSKIIKEEHFLDGFLEFFKITAKCSSDDYFINIENFIEIFKQELLKRQ